MATRYDLRPVDRRSLWRENHGNFLLSFAAGILLVGLAILGYRQWRPATSRVRYIRSQPQVIEAPAELGDDSLEAPADGLPPLEASNAQPPAPLNAGRASGADAVDADE